MKLRTFLAAAAMAVFAAPALAGAIEIHDGYAFSSHGGAATGAVFMVIQNTTETADRLIGVRSDIAERTEIHTTIDGGDGTMQMRMVEGPLDLPAGGELVLERGGLHVMFMGLQAPLVDGESVTITLLFETAGEVEVTVPVDLTPPAMTMGN